MAGAYDVAIVGGGIVGCSVFFELDRVGYSCVLLEKNENLLSEASSGNRYVCANRVQMQSDMMVGLAY